MDIKTIISEHHPRFSKKRSESDKSERIKHATTSEIPDIFFDEILLQFKLTRIEILVLMYLYRTVWCRPNLHKKYGISPLLSHSELSLQLKITKEELYQSLRKLEELEFIETIRAGQYFVRKYFTAEYDAQYGHFYDDFL